MSRTRKGPEERRAELIAATAELMLERGLHAVTTRDVTRRVGVGTGLLSHYFTWRELRRHGFEALARRGTEATFESGGRDDPPRALRRLLDSAFVRGADPYWRAWSEAIDAAVDDRELARAVERCAREVRERLETLLRAGNGSGAWSCADPAGAAWRILAVQDGLAGYVLGGAPPLSRRAAKAHLRIAIGHELGERGWS